MSPPRISKLPPVSLLFERKKAAIISSLSTPDEDYTDLSPKGSVDAGIRSLIDQINNIDGVVTTSSCAGRISVFLEGVKKDALQGHDPNEQTTVPGGKGMGGKWLFVSHDPVDVPLRKGDGDAPITDMLGSRPQEDALLEAQVDPDARFVKLQFEPMILHIMTASLHRAQPILSAAIDAGFRESGVQSLKNLDDPNAFPMVAVRTAGLGLGSIIGYADEYGNVQGLVSEEYLGTLLKIANSRFSANSERIQRFSDRLFSSGEGRRSAWEDSQARSERKRAEGLKRKEKIRTNGDISVKDDAYSALDGVGLSSEAEDIFLK